MRPIDFVLREIRDIEDRVLSIQSVEYSTQVAPLITKLQAAYVALEPIMAKIDKALDGEDA